jgi:hypothetical protein
MTKMRVGPNLVVKGRVNMDDIDILVKLDEAIQQANELEQMIDLKKARDSFFLSTPVHDLAN